MRPILTLLTAAVMLTALTGCAAMREAEARRQARLEAARTAEYDVARDDVLEAVLTTLLHLDYQILRQNQEMGLYETAWCDRSMYGATHKVRIIVEISGNGPYSAAVRGEVITTENLTAKSFEDEVYERLYQRLSPEEE